MAEKRTYLRIVFWAVFLPVIALLFLTFGPVDAPEFIQPVTSRINAASVKLVRYYYERRIDRYARQLAHPNAKVASEAWWKMRELYFSKWAAVDPVYNHALDPEPIHFLIEKDGADFFARKKAIYYKADRIYCYTVGEAVLSFVHKEPKWRTDFAGDWNQWWQANKGFYGKID